MFHGFLNRVHEKASRTDTAASHAHPCACTCSKPAHTTVLPPPLQVDSGKDGDCSIRYMHPKDTLAAIACVAPEAAEASAGGLESSEDRMAYELVYAPSEQTIFFVGSSSLDLKHAYSVVRIGAESKQPEPWQRCEHEMSRAVPGFRVCSVLNPKP
jgi:hypothetical protein